MRTSRIIIAALALWAPPALAQAGPVTVWFTEQPQAVSDRLALLCADRNAAVIEQDERHVLCQREVTGGRGILAQAFIGNGSSTSPQLMIRFAILRDGKAARVQASQWVELQMAGGQTRRSDLNDRKQRASLEDLLTGAGGHNVPPEALDDTAPAIQPPHDGEMD